MPKRNCKFTDVLKNDYPFLKEVIGNVDKVKCEKCLSEFSISHGGRSDIKNHLKCAKHRASLIAAENSSKISSYFFNNNAKDCELLTAAKEATFAFHVAIHNLSFRSADCSSKLISKLFENNFRLARTKCEAVIVNVIEPMIFQQLCKDLHNANFVTISTDCSNRNEIKAMPCVVRYFIPTYGVKVKLLEFQTVTGETAAILTDHLMSVIIANNLSNKIIGYCGDNCNTNFGGVNRRGENNVYSLLKKKLGRDIVGIGCGAHIVHNCLQTAVDVLPVEIEALVVKIYKYFYIYTVRVTRLKNFCEFVDIEYKKILSHSNTRFLSLLPAINRILEIYEGLKSYFLSQENCPLIIKNFFENDCSEIYLWFVQGQLKLFNNSILTMEGNKSCATDIANELEKLKYNLKERRDNGFIPQEAKRLIEIRLNMEDTNKIYQELVQFYDRCLSYIRLWENSFGGAEFFKWINKFQLTWPEIEASGLKINEICRNKVINLDELFDEVVVIKPFWSENYEMWKNICSEEKLVKLFNYLNKKSIFLPNIFKIIEWIFCLPGTSAPVERIFSTMNNIWSEERCKMKESTVKALLRCKANSELNCSDFFDYIKNNKDFLNQIRGQDKYLQ